MIFWLVAKICDEQIGQKMTILRTKMTGKALSFETFGIAKMGIALELKTRCLVEAL